MSLTLGLTGMDPATETALRAAFVDANARLGGQWSLVPDAEADHVVVDMDSMYGPMSWLRLHAAGRKVIGLTSAPRTQTDYRLGRPFDTEQMADLLAGIARDAGVRLMPVAAGSDATPTAIAGEPEGDEAAAATATDAADAAHPGPDTSRSAEAEAAPADDGTAPATAELPAFEDLAEAPIHADAADRTDTVPAAPAERDLAAWLRPGVLHGRHRFVSGHGPVLLLDADAELWHGPATLKPLVPCFEGIVDAGAFEAIEADAWDRETAKAGPAQPLARLRWLGGLLAGGGALLPGVDPAGRFQLTRWPQTEREFPRHFRIATQMMKGPATVAAIAEASGMPEADVADFINANLATGFAEPVAEAPAPAEPPKPRGGLLGRLRR